MKEFTETEIRLINYVNATMKDINNLTDNLYEGLIDNDSTEITTICNQLIGKLNHIKSTNKQ